MRGRLWTVAFVMGGTAVLPTFASAGSTAGGASPSGPAVIRSAACTGGCPTLNAVRPGSALRIEGRDMAAVAKVTFLGRGGRRDDVTAAPSAVSATSVDVIVPPRVRTGKLRLVNVDGKTSRASRRKLSVRRKGAARVLQTRVKARKAAAGSAQPAQLDILVQKAVTVTVAVIRVADGAPVAGFPLGPVAPGVVRSVQWDGAVAGVAQAPGPYEFRVYMSVPGQASAASNPPAATARFELTDHAFPVAGPHRYGTGPAAFGGGRGHEGHDVFADCGTPLVAARGGRVRTKAFQRRAGHYVVITGAGTGLDYVYMHLAKPALVKAGQIVATGQQIGEVGDTGRADGCHLHFELWNGAGWQSGGRPVDPLPLLRSWDG